MLSRRRLLLAATCLPFRTLAQSSASSAGSAWIPPKSADGHPDFSGYWTNVTLTPLERPRKLGDKAFFTPAEAAAYERVTIVEHRQEATPDSLWNGRAHVVSTLRTSLIIDPSDGRLPRPTQAALRRAGEAREARRDHPADGPEDRQLAERCILWPTAGPPMLPGFDKYQIVESENYIAIVSEIMHQTRVIPLGNRPHLPESVRQWLGDSRGHWEGGTLVVETTNFTDKTPLHSSSKDMRLTERFTRTAPDTILYQFTVNDPESFAAPWTAEIPMHPAEGPLAEYACQENNEDLARILSGARAAEKREAESQK